MRARVFVRDVEAPRDSMATVRARGGQCVEFVTDGGSLGSKNLTDPGRPRVSPPSAGRNPDSLRSSVTFRPSVEFDFLLVVYLRRYFRK